MKLSEVMKRSTFIRGHSRVIFNINLSGIETLQDLADVNKYIHTIIEKMPKRSMLLLLDVRGLNMTGEITGLLRSMSVDHSAYFRSSAVVADNSNQRNMKDLVGSIGLKKMNVHLSFDAARQELLDAE